MSRFDPIASPRLYNLHLDPKETHNYMTRKLAYVEADSGSHLSEPAR